MLHSSRCLPYNIAPYLPSYPRTMSALTPPFQNQAPGTTNKTHPLLPNANPVHGQRDQGLARGLEERDRGRKLLGRILNYFEEQRDSAAPRKNNRLHKDMEKGSIGIEIRHGQKSRSHQRLSSEEVKMKQF